MYRRKNIVITVMCLVMLFMAIGYAAFSTVLNISGTASTDSKWNIRFTDITEGEAVGKANNRTTPSYLNNSATMDVNLEEPGDSMTYVLTLTNDGNINAVVEDIIAEESGSMAITYTISGINIGQKLVAGTSIEITIKIEYNPAVTSQPIDTSKTLTVLIDTVQDLGQVTTEKEPVIVSYSTLREKVLMANSPKDDLNINFGEISSETNGQGLYYTATNTENGKITYYFRGNVENNYVSFANHIWRIVRINEDGSIRLIKETNAGNSKFNDESDNSAVGFMYGTVGATGDDAYVLTHKNTNDSDIKDYLDDWYVANLGSYSKYLADAGFCNDRSVAKTANTWASDDTTLGYGKNITYYGTYNRIYQNNNPQFACPNPENDLFTLKESSKGNKGLINPIGLLTLDEVVYAGGKAWVDNENYYLVNGAVWLTMSPRYFDGTDVYIWDVFGNGLVSNSHGDYESYGVRPVINLKSDVKVSTGDGSSGTPYVIKMEQ